MGYVMTSTTWKFVNLMAMIVVVIILINSQPVLIVNVKCKKLYNFMKLSYILFFNKVEVICYMDPVVSSNQYFY